MAIIDTITDMSRLYGDLEGMGRKNFSYEGAKALMEYLRDFSENTRVGRKCIGRFCECIRKIIPKRDTA